MFLQSYLIKILCLFNGSKGYLCHYIDKHGLEDHFCHYINQHRSDVKNNNKNNKKL